MTRDSGASEIRTINQVGNNSVVHGDQINAGSQVNIGPHSRRSVPPRGAPSLPWRVVGLGAAVVLVGCAIWIGVTVGSGTHSVDGITQSSSTVNWPAWICAMTSVTALLISVHQTYFRRQRRSQR